ncbi:hypothetical protein Scep_005945 [Stephania cephalantha]|uniref:Uncharacterized protein n=1 Tax=Stephania cephalantha TaxID=152367 RepID=A0AAP0PJL5_9MAGN
MQLSRTWEPGDRRCGGVVYKHCCGSCGKKEMLDPLRTDCGQRITSGNWSSTGLPRGSEQQTWPLNGGWISAVRSWSSLLDS